MFSKKFLSLLILAAGISAGAVIIVNRREIQKLIKLKEVPETKAEKISKKISEKNRKKSKKRKEQKTSSLFDLNSVTRGTARILKKVGYKNIKDIAIAPFSIFLQKTGLELSRAAKIFNEARKPTSKEKQ